MPSPRLLTLAAVVLLAGPAVAAKPVIKIEDAQIGLPGRRVSEVGGNSRAQPVVKRNTWAPLYVKFEMLREYGGKAKLKIVSEDADDLSTTLIVPLNTTFQDRLPGSKIDPTELGSVPYVRCGDLNGRVTLTVLSDPPDGDPKAISDPYVVGEGSNYASLRNTSTYVVLSLGTNLPGFDLTEEGKNQGQAGRGALRGGRVETASLTDVGQMPDQWFGYAAADLVVLATGSAPDEFLDQLFDEQLSGQFKDRRDALVEWVRRGGKLVISVGSKANRLAQYDRLRDLLPAPIARDQATREEPDLRLSFPRSATVGGSVQAALSPVAPKPAAEPKEGDPPPPPAKPATLRLARFGPNPGRPYRTLLADRRDERKPIPLVVQAPLGLGRVTVVGFDLDTDPFAHPTTAQWRPDFWDWLIREAGSQKSAVPQSTGSNANVYGYGSYGSALDPEDEYLAALRTHVDTFDGVPVVSFGWVALFIVLYALLIGPVEYLFLKKILRGRLEYTWVTFPVIVLTVSAAAYLTAYQMKGDDLKVNKVDVVDVDLHGGRVYGRTWFTVFSPRIDSYTIGVEPADGWAAPTPPGSPAPAPLVGWMGGGRGGGGSLVSRGYTYHADPAGRAVADGLERVPIQVWSTKAFTANWSGYTPRGAAGETGKPLIDADLYHPPGKPDVAVGSFVNNLPAKALKDPVIFYAGKAYKPQGLQALTPGQKVDVNLGGSAAADTQWFTTFASLGQVASVAQNVQQQQAYGSSGNRTPTPADPRLGLWGALFHEEAARKESRALQNASLRDLDQSWRLTDDNLGEAILVARVDRETGPAEDLLTDPAGPSATRLWLKNLPGDPKGREKVPGTLRQETYVRVYIPVKAKPGK